MGFLDVVGFRASGFEGFRFSAVCRNLGFGVEGRWDLGLEP